MRGEQFAGRALAAVHRHPAGDLADLGGGAAVHLGHLAQGAREAQAVVVAHHRRARFGVLAKDPRENPVALVPRKIEVDIGRVLARRVEEALEEQVGAQRFDVGDAEAVGDDRIGDGAAAAVRGAVLHDVVHHEEVVGEVLEGNDLQFVLEPVAGDRGDGAVAAHRAVVREGAQPADRIAGVRSAGRDDPPHRDAIPAPLGDVVCGGEGLGHIGEVTLDIGCGTKPGLARPGIIHFRQGDVAVNGAQQPVPVPVIRVRGNDAAGHDRGNAKAPCRREGGMTSRARAQFGMEPGRAAGAHQLFEQHHIATHHDQPVAIRGEVCHKVKVIVPVDRRGSAAERAPAVIVLGQHHRFVPAGHEVTAENRAHACCITGALELDRAVDAVGVGHGDGRNAAPCRGLRQRLGRGGAAAEGEPGVDVQMREHDGLEKRERRDENNVNRPAPM